MSTARHLDVPLYSGGAGVSQLPPQGLLPQSHLNHAIPLCPNPLTAPSLPDKEVYFKEGSEREVAFWVLPSSVPQNILQGRSVGAAVAEMFTE